MSSQPPGSKPPMTTLSPIQERCILMLEWVAVAVTLAGATTTSAGIDPLNMYLLNIGSILWLLWAVWRRQYSIALVNVGLLLIYLAGLLKRIDFVGIYDTIALRIL